MEFKLCFKVYPYIVNLGALRKFKETTGECLWSTLLSYYAAFNELSKDGLSVASFCAELSKKIDFVTASHLFHILAKQENSLITLEEIQDSMFHAGVFPSDNESGLINPWSMVLANVSADFVKSQQELHIKKKVDPDS